MPYVAVNPQRLIGKSVGNGQCVAFARAAASIGHTSTWTRGELVRGATLAISSYLTNGGLGQARATRRSSQSTGEH